MALDQGASEDEARARAAAHVSDWHALAADILRTRKSAGASRLDRRAEAADPGGRAQRLAEGLSQGDAHVLHRVVEIHGQIALRLQKIRRARREREAAREPEAEVEL